MIRNDFKGDFTGFQFGEYHSSDLGIVRVSSGDRYNENLHPEIKDKTAEVPGVNGNYYFGSDFGPKTIDIEFAFDSITEEQFKNLRKIFGTKEIKKLIFDERPYKYYMAKIGSPIELSYVCFDEPKKIIGAARDGVRVKNRIPITEEIDGETVVIGYDIEREQVTPYEKISGTERIYKGEGKISFICYYPFAKSEFKTLPIGVDCSSWADSSGIFSYTEYTTTKKIDQWIDGQEQGDDVGYIKLYNPGDIATGFRLYCPFGEKNQQTGEYQYVYPNDFMLIYRINYNAGKINVDPDWEEVARLTFNEIVPIATDEGILIDTNTCLVTGVKDFEIRDKDVIYKTTDNLYNKFIKNGEFFKIQPTDLYETYQYMIAVINGNEHIKIFYDYIYF